MLVRQTRHSQVECITQQHHAMLSGMLAQAWARSHLHPTLVTAITEHDAPWRDVDAEPTYNPQTGLPYDFIDYPLGDKIHFYRAGIDALERLHPYVAYLVSLHYTTFAGTNDLEKLQAPERKRRARLKEQLDAPLVSGAETALKWVKFFDVFSLHLCLTGPETDPSSLPSWLEESSTWSRAPDGSRLDLRWRDASSLEVTPWPFDKAMLEFSLHYRPLPGPVDSEADLREAWQAASPQRRGLELRPG